MTASSILRDVPTNRLSRSRPGQVRPGNHRRIAHRHSAQIVCLRPLWHSGADDMVSTDISMAKNINLERRAEIGLEKRTRTREVILAAAFELLGRQNGRSTRIEEICDRAGVSRGTYYNYFSGMDELFDALSYDISHAFNAAVIGAIETLPSSSLRVASALRYYLHRARRDPSWGWAMVNISATGPIFGSETLRHATESVQQGIDAGEFRLPDTIIGRDLMIGTIFASMITILKEPKPPEYPEMVVRQILSAFGVPKPVIRHCLTIDLPALEEEATKVILPG